MKKQIGTIDLTPTWEQTVNVCLEIIRNAPNQHAAENELRRIGKLLDAALKWHPIEIAPTEEYQFFLIRVKGNHPNFGRPYTPTVVQQIDGEFYTPSDELTPLVWGIFTETGEYVKATRDQLEWRHIGEGSLNAQSQSHTGIQPTGSFDVALCVDPKRTS